MSGLASEIAVDFRDALNEFEAAWENPKHTRFTLPAVPVNSVLAKQYTTSASVSLGHGAAEVVGSSNVYSLCRI
jgi:hypothetical protein